ncbi:MAG: membrane protein insertase YidC [Chloroflexi bacterium]|nr:membrane protein insertase YidC [Chloroflexota bacterium]
MLDFITNPFITILLFLYQILGGNVVLAIIVFTILVRVALYPLTLKQHRSTKAMQQLQPELKKLQEKYKNDRERLAQAQWDLYREYGVNPLAGCLPLLIQLPIMLGLYRAIVASMAATPLQLLELSERIYVHPLSSQVPLQNQFLWLNLGVPDPLYILPILVVATTFLQQKLLMPSTPKPEPGSGDSASDQAAAMSRQMMTIMPIMFGIFSLSFASGLSIYFIASNIIGIGQYAAMGRIDFRRILGLAPKEEETEVEPVKAKARKETVSSRPSKARPSTASAAVSEPISIKSSGDSSKLVIKPKRAGIRDSRAERATARRNKS